MDIKVIFKTVGTVLTNRGEDHSSTEEDKGQEREQEYYYADYLLRTGKITKEQYDKGLELANEIIKEGKPVTYHPELLDIELFNQMYGKKEEVQESKKAAKKKETNKKTEKVSETKTKK